MCRHIYDWNTVNCDVKQPIYLTLPNLTVTSSRSVISVNMLLGNTWKMLKVLLVNEECPKKLGVVAILVELHTATGSLGLWTLYVRASFGVWTAIARLSSTDVLWISLVKADSMELIVLSWIVDTVRLYGRRGFGLVSHRGGWGKFGRFSIADFRPYIMLNFKTADFRPYIMLNFKTWQKRNKSFPVKK